MNPDKVRTAPDHPHTAHERYYRRRTQTATRPLSHNSDEERERRTEDFRPGGQIPIPHFSMPLRQGAEMSEQGREQQDADIVPPPRSAKRAGRDSGPSRLSPQQARHVRDLQLDEVCREEVREGRKSLENRRRAGEAKVFHRARDVEKHDKDIRDSPEPDPNRYRPFSCSKTLNHVFDYIAMSPSFYVGVVLLAVFLATTLFLVLRPPQALEVMRLDTKHVFSGGNYSSNSFIAWNCKYELLAPGSHLTSDNTSDVGRHRPLRLDREKANISISNHIELYMFSSCYNDYFGRQCQFGNPLLPLNWNITRVVESSIKPTFNGLNEAIKSELVSAALKEDYVKEINKKVAEANPDPAGIDMLSWGWPMPVWPKPSSFSSMKSDGLTRTVLLLGQNVFDGEIRTGDVTSTLYGVILITFVAAICFLGILIPYLIVMGSREQFSHIPWWGGYLGAGLPFAILAIVGVSLKNGASDWSASRCTIVHYAGLALRPFWIRDYLQWYFWGLVVLFEAFALAYLIDATFSKHGLVDSHNFGSWGFVGFWVLSFLALLTATFTGQRSMKTKAQAINSISEFLGMSAVPGKGYWIAVCVAEFLTLWAGLAFLSHSLNFRFRERKMYLPCKSSEGMDEETGVTTKSGATISAALTSSERTGTPGGIIGAEIQSNPAKRRACSPKQETEQPRRESVIVVAEEMEGKDGDDQRSEAENLCRSKDKGRVVLEALADEEQSDEDEVQQHASEDQNNSDKEQSDENRVQQHAREVQDNSALDTEQDMTNERQTDEGEHDELRDKPGSVDVRPRIDADNRLSWLSWQDGSSRRGSGHRARESISEGCQQSDKDDAASESSRSGG